MTKKQIKLLVFASYKGDTLDSKKVFKIARLLNRKNLKKYINELKSVESKKTVIVTTSFPPQKDIMPLNLFPDKKIVYKSDPSLGIGVRIQCSDMLYELNLKDTLGRILSHLEQKL